MWDIVTRKGGKTDDDFTLAPEFCYQGNIIVSRSNFDFLTQEFSEIAEAAHHMEQLVVPDARAACFYGRRAIELLIHWLYEHDAELVVPYSGKLGALLAEPTFHR